MSAGHQIKKAREAAQLENWLIGKKRTYNGVTYGTRKDREIARKNDLIAKKHASTAARKAA